VCVLEGNVVCVRCQWTTAITEAKCVVCLTPQSLSACATASGIHSPYTQHYIDNNTLQLQPFNGLFSRTTWVSRYQKGKTNLDFTGARDSEWQWHQLDHMQVCTLLQTDNHASTPPLCFLQAGCPSCHPTNSIKALKAHILIIII